MGSRDKEQESAFGGALRAMISPRECPSVLLDFGCGSGRFTPLLSSLCDRYIGVDISSNGLSFAATPENGVFKHLEEDRIPLDDQSVDMVVAVTVFQHIVSDKDFDLWTKEIVRVLKPGMTGSAVVIDEMPKKGVSRPQHMKPRYPLEIARALHRGIELYAALNHTEHWVARIS
jgi:ubiquinone/menaquinone biosynthesis C-methylase UbiE